MRQPMNPAPGRGLALMEALVACVVVAVALQGLLLFQVQLLGRGQSAVAQMQANRLAEDLFERLDRQSVADVLSTFEQQAAETSGADCRQAACHASELMAWQVRRWQQHVAQQLPQGASVAFAVSGDARQLGVQLSWRDATFQAMGPRGGAPSPDPDSIACPAHRWCAWAFGVP